MEGIAAKSSLPGKLYKTQDNVIIGYGPDFSNPRFSEISKHRETRQEMKDEASYNCESCGEENVVPVDLSAGSVQEYVEDCPVCCCQNVIRIEIDDDGKARAWASRE